MRYLSDEWINAANTALGGLAPSERTLAVSYTVRHGPEGERSYTLDLGTPSVRPGADAPVGFRLHWDTAVAIATGERSAQRAFLDGDLQIIGDAPALLSGRDDLAGAEAALATIKDHTDYH